MTAWLKHVKATMKANVGMPFKEVLKLAGKTYKKGESVVKYAVTGKKTRKHRRRRGKSGKRKRTGKKRGGGGSKRRRSSRRRRR